jgi:uncharacterized protein HemX
VTERANDSEAPEGATPARRGAGFGWIALHALLWLAVGAGATFWIEWGRARRPALADAVEQADERLRQLGLTEEQSRALDSIRRDWKTAVLDAERGYVDHVFTAATAADEKIRALLTEGQRERYRELALPPAPK